MPKWSELKARVLPWLASEDQDTRRLLDEAAAETIEQERLAPLIEAQTDFLVTRGQINGFTSQLRVGFARRIAGE